MTRPNTQRRHKLCAELPRPSSWDVAVAVFKGSEGGREGRRAHAQEGRLLLSMRCSASVASSASRSSSMERLSAACASSVGVSDGVGLRDGVGLVLRSSAGTDAASDACSAAVASSASPCVSSVHNPTLRHRVSPRPKSTDLTFRCAREPPAHCRLCRLSHIGSVHRIVYHARCPLQLLSLVASERGEAGARHRAGLRQWLFHSGE